MQYKTISGHYDTVYSLEHNNRKFIPQNVDYRRIARNYNCIEAGGEAHLDLEDPRCLAEFWERYRELADLYWKDRVIVRAREYERYKENVRYLRQLSYRLYHCPDDPAGLFIHCDEATPGIHLTCIPYSRGCKRGPEVQAALGRAMTGMGYPSTWTDVLDENGERVPKR